MNIFDIVNNKLLELIDNKQTEYINNFIEDNVNQNELILRNKKLNINIIGMHGSGKTTMLIKLLKGLGRLNIFLKHIKILDTYNEKDIFDEIIVFNKTVLNKNVLKVLVIDDYNSFSSTFKSKINSLLHQKNINISVVVGEHIPNNVYINTDHLFNNTEISDILNIIPKHCAREYEILSFLLKNVTEFYNIRTLLINVNILRFVDFGILDGLYYNNTVEEVHIYNCLYRDELNKKELISFLSEKYKNNENIKDTILLVEMSIFYIMRTAIKKSDCLSSSLIKILDICNELKKDILYLKCNNRHMNNKLLFGYFILKMKQL